MKHFLKLSLFIFFGCLASIQNSYACHAIALLNIGQQIVGANDIQITADSDPATNGCDEYWLDVEVRCLNDPFDGAPFAPGFYGPLNTYPYFQSAHMLKPAALQQQYPWVTIPYSSLCAGMTYQYRMRENHNGLAGPWCAAQNFVAPGVTDPLIISAAASQTVICVGDCIDLNAAVVQGCGLAAVYTWDNGIGVGQSITNVCPTVTTTYCVDVVEACSGFTDNVCVTVTVTDPPVNGTAAVTPTTFCTNANPALTLTGQTGVIQWQSAPNAGGGWTNIPGGTTPNFNPGAITATTCYRAEITGCGAGGPPTVLYSNVVCVTQATPSPPTMTFTNETCDGLNNGTAAAVPVGMTNPITYSWSNTTPTQTTDTATGLAPGSYTVTVSDANGCTETGTVTILAGPVFSGTETHVDPSCNGGSNGTATVALTGGNPGYTYSWNTTPVQATNPATGLGQGNYIATVTDTDGCKAFVNVIINEPTPVAFNFVPTDNLCPDSCAGSIAAGAAGGTAPYTYLWNDPNTQTTGTATGLCAGTYTVTLTDSLGCNITDSAVVADPLAMVVNLTATPASCNQSDGSVNITVTANGTAPITFSWTDGTSNVGNTGLVNGLPAGTYFGTATDFNGCSVTDTVTITNLSGPTLTVDSVYAVQCFGGSDGYTEVSITGGAFPYTYAWNTTPAQTTPAATNLTAGTYTITVTDSNGCIVSSAVTITEPTELQLISGGTDPSCFTFADGSAWVNASGGTGGTYTYSWNTAPPQTTDTATALSSGSYTVTVVDSNMCFDSATVVLADPLLFTVNVTGNNISCFGACDGDAITTLNNGVAPFTYLWDDPGAQTTDSIFGLCDTTVSVIVTDSMGCIANGSVLITQPALLVVTEDSVAHIDVDCFGNATGSANLNVSGGTGVYIYDWVLNGATVSTGQNANNLIAGTYTVTVTDGNGCSETVTVIITEPVVLTSTATPTDADCFGANTGSAFATPAGGTGPYTYLWTNVAQQQTDTAFNLVANTYDVTVTDSNNCTVTVTGIVIGEPNELILNSSSVSSTCGHNNGSASIIVNGGSFPYTYAWNSLPPQTTGTAFSLPANNYTVIVTDFNGCVDSATISVTDLGGPTVTIPTSTDVSCNGAGNGSAQSAVTGGIAPYTYLWNTGLPGDTLANVTGLNAQTYSVTITDSNNCIASASVTIAENSGVSAVINTSTNVSCFGGNDGTASVTPTGGAGGTYTYSWNTLAGAAAGATPTTAANSTLAAGDYYVIVTDSNGCIANDTITITEPPLLEITGFNIDSVTCNGLSDGVVDVTFAGGTLGYTYVWTPNVSTGATGTGLAAGPYNVQVTDNNGCIKDSTYTVFEPDQLVIGTTSIGATCSNANGSATVTITTPSTPGYTYSWNDPNNQTTATAINLPASTYIVTVSDKNNCSVFQNVVVTNLPGPIIDSVIVTPITCNGFNDGTATVYSSGGSLPLTYLWDDPSAQTTQTATALASSPPLYSVIVTDANGCSSPTGVAQISEPNSITPQIISPDTVCHGEALQLFANASGGTTPYLAFNWSGGINQAGQGPILDTLTSLTSYNLIVVDANACVSPMISKTIYVRAKPVFTVDGATICQDDSATIFPSPVTGGDPSQTFTFYWMEVDSLTNTYTGLSSGGSFTTSPSETTDYAIYVDNVCAVSDTFGFTVNVNDTAINQLAIVADQCQGTPQIFSLTTDIGAAFDWDFDNDGLIDASTSDTNTVFTYPYSGTYNVRVVTTTAEGCISTMTVNGLATVNPNPIADFTTNPSPAIVTLANPYFDFIDQSVGNNNVTSFLWDFDDLSIDTLNVNPYHEYQDTGYYEVSLTVTNEFGCVDVIEKTVRVKPDFLFAIPNTITPDGDGLNDFFSPGTLLGAADSDYAFYIFDRWGELIFEGHDLRDSWDGTFKGKVVQNGVFIWKVEITDLEGTSRNFHGHVNVLR